MKRVIVLLLSAACLVGCQGCGTAGREGVRTVHITVLDGGKLSVNGHITSEKGLAGAVKATGAGPATSIEVALPQGAPQSVIVSITRELRRAGYTKILFARPRQAKVST